METTKRKISVERDGKNIIFTQAILDSKGKEKVFSTKESFASLKAKSKGLDRKEFLKLSKSFTQAIKADSQAKKAGLISSTAYCVVADKLAKVLEADESVFYVNKTDSKKQKASKQKKAVKTDVKKKSVKTEAKRKAKKTTVKAPVIAEAVAA